MNPKGSYSAVVAVLAVALLGVTLLSVKLEERPANDLGAAYDARPAWINALALAEDELRQVAEQGGCEANPAQALAVLERETGFKCGTRPAVVRAQGGEASFELSCEKTAGALAVSYAQQVRVRGLEKC